MRTVQPLVGPAEDWAPSCPTGSQFPGASLLLQLEPTDVDERVWLRLRDGEAHEFGLGTAERPDLTLAAPTDALQQFLMGRLPMPELLRAGTIDFHQVTFVSLATGLFESHANRQFWEAAS
jgi:hypothetical protein